MVVVWLGDEWSMCGRQHSCMYGYDDIWPRDAPLLAVEVEPALHDLAPVSVRLLRQPLLVRWCWACQSGRNRMHQTRSHISI